MYNRKEEAGVLSYDGTIIWEPQMNAITFRQDVNGFEETRKIEFGLGDTMSEKECIFYLREEFIDRLSARREQFAAVEPVFMTIWRTSVRVLGKPISVLNTSTATRGD